MSWAWIKKWVWKAKSHFGVSGVLGLESSSSTTMPPHAPMVEDVAQTCSSIIDDSSGGILIMVLSLKVEEGVLVSQDVEKEELYLSKEIEEGELERILMGGCLN